MLLLMALLALWLGAYAYSVYHLILTGPRNAATLPHLSGTVGFLGWQGVAGIIAFGCWGVGRSFPRGFGIRRISAVPLGMALAMAMVIGGMSVLGGM